MKFTVFCLMVFMASWVQAEFSVTQLVPGHYVHKGQQDEMTRENHGDIANVGFVVGANCVAVIDTGASKTEGELLLKEIRKLTPLPVCYVINTHFHLDHIYGNAAFLAEKPVFISHLNLPQAAAQRDAVYQKTLQQEIGESSPLVLPTETVANKKTLDLGGRQLLLEAWPTAHTNTDITVWDDKAKVWWVSDLLFVDRLPVLDGSILGWLSQLDLLEQKVEQRMPRVIIAGHGDTKGDWQGALKRERAYFLDLKNKVSRAIDEGMPLSVAINKIRPADDKWLLLEHYHRRNVSAAFAELEWK